METDNQIKSFIENNYPVVNDNGKFLSELQEKLVIMDQAQSIYEKEVKDSNRWIAVAFVIGAVFGAAGILSVIFCTKPALPSISNVYGFIFELVVQGRFFIFATILSATGLTIYIKKRVRETICK